MKTPITCPACSKPFSTNREGGVIIVWCDGGTSCPSTKANDGIKGRQKEGVEAIANRLKQKLESSPDWSLDQPNEESEVDRKIRLDLERGDYKHDLEKSGE